MKSNCHRIKMSSIELKLILIGFFRFFIFSFLVMAVLLSYSRSSQASFVVADKTSGIDEVKPSIAGNTQNGDFLAAYLEEIEIDGQTNRWEVRIKRFSASGQQIGDVIIPFNSYAHIAMGRPAVVYNPTNNQFIVAAPVMFFGIQVVWINRFDHLGNSLSWSSDIFLSLGNDLSFCEGNGHSALRIVHNSTLNEFVVTAQWTGNSGNGVWSQRLTSSGSKIGSPILLNEVDYCSNYDMASHGIAYSPHPGLGCYLFVFGRNGVRLLDTNLNPITGPGFIYGDLYLLFGHPEGNNYQLDVAYGTVQGHDRFLIVYADSNNCQPDWQDGSCPNIQDQSTGVWGLFIDPDRTDYSVPGESYKKVSYPTPFPITSLYAHYVDSIKTKPKVVYCSDAKAFAVVWREIPSNHPNNDEIYSHIRGAWVTNFVEDGMYGTSLDYLYSMPPKNLVLSEIIPNYCASGGCYSYQDPDFPGVAPNGEGTAVAVWQQNQTNIGITLDVRGALFPELPMIDNINFDSCISEQCTTTLVASAHDPEGGILTFEWDEFNDGSLNGTGASFVFDPPGPSIPPNCYPYHVKLTVTSSVSGLSFEEIVGITVKLAGDANGDGVVNILDKVAVRNAFGSTGSNPADVNCDNVVNILDKVVVRNQFGQSGCGCP